MAIATLAFNIKAWLGLLLPKRAGGAQLLTMGFRRFIHVLILIPVQIKKALLTSKWVEVQVGATRSYAIWAVTA